MPVELRRDDHDDLAAHDYYAARDDEPAAHDHHRARHDHDPIPNNYGARRDDHDTAADDHYSATHYEHHTAGYHDVRERLDYVHYFASHDDHHDFACSCVRGPRRRADVGERVAEVAGGLVEPRVITASDALFVLRTGVGSETCALCVCDVNGSGGVTASDALVVLRQAVGQSVSLQCPACSP